MNIDQPLYRRIVSAVMLFGWLPIIMGLTSLPSQRAEKFFSSLEIAISAIEDSISREVPGSEIREPFLSRLEGVQDSLNKGKSEIKSMVIKRWWIELVFCVFTAFACTMFWKGGRLSHLMLAASSVALVYLSDSLSIALLIGASWDMMSFRSSLDFLSRDLKSFFHNILPLLVATITIFYLIASSFWVRFWSRSNARS